MTHPCDGHRCDHCYLCDVVGVCCATVSPDERRRLEGEHQTSPSGRFHTAIRRDAGTVPSLPGLVRLAAHQYPAGLIAASRLGLLVAPDPLYPDSRKEAVRVAIPRTLR
jgi:hypothetical protein